MSLFAAVGLCPHVNTARIFFGLGIVQLGEVLCDEILGHRPLVADRIVVTQVHDAQVPRE